MNSAYKIYSWVLQKVTDLPQNRPFFLEWQTEYDQTLHSHLHQILSKVDSTHYMPDKKQKIKWILYVLSEENSSALVGWELWMPNKNIERI